MSSLIPKYRLTTLNTFPSRTGTTSLKAKDAIALAVRFECPIYTYEFVLSSAGIILDDDEPEDSEVSDLIEEEYKKEDFSSDPVERLTLDELQQKLKDSIENEDYESASKIRDDIKRRSGN